ncbi:NlpC/P60 family protein [uncultured Sphaerochaeta sp.]|uniref:NlpC/P60 family protein n=1 Tax=uncultured Sphaerochaeta sp. TaxID=886478 RepID=UPI002A0A33A4|nr:NlpC/P60 family protein [uncultured Sphaerochaeta sp.]
MNLVRYLAIPYADQGRSETGCDCWGFARIILAEETGLLLPEFSYIKDKAKAGEAMAGFSKIQDPCDFDLVHMKGYGYLLHVGIYYQGGILHMTAAGPSYQPEKKLADRILGFYRSGIFAIV